MRFEKFSFGAIRIDGATYEHDVVIDRGEVSKRQKKASKKFRDEFGHTPLSMDEVRREALRRRVELLALPTIEAIKALQENPKDTNAVLHVTC
jgi:hypothetical protein